MKRRNWRAEVVRIKELCSCDVDTAKGLYNEVVAQTKSGLDYEDALKSVIATATTTKSKAVTVTVKVSCDEALMPLAREWVLSQLDHDHPYFTVE